MQATLWPDRNKQRSFPTTIEDPLNQAADHHHSECTHQNPISRFFCLVLPDLLLLHRKAAKICAGQLSDRQPSRILFHSRSLALVPPNELSPQLGVRFGPRGPQGSLCHLITPAPPSPWRPLPPQSGRPCSCFSCLSFSSPQPPSSWLRHASSPAFPPSSPSSSTARHTRHRLEVPSTLSRLAAQLWAP